MSTSQLSTSQLHATMRKLTAMLHNFSEEMRIELEFATDDERIYSTGQPLGLSAAPAAASEGASHDPSALFDRLQGTQD